jgi:threonine dehydrogenase-like Zn-dependent dehydrogenase
MPEMMKSALFVEPGRIVLDDKPIPDVGSNDALIRITTTTICGTDVHIGIVTLIECAAKSR